MKKIIFILMMISQPIFSSDVIYQQQSLYSEIVIREKEGIRCMQFTSEKTLQKYYQGCISTTHTAFVFNYSKAIMASLFLKPDPKRLLFIGMGPGIVPKAMHLMHPEATIDVVDIDSVVIELAHDYFSFPTSPNIKTFVEDGRFFVNKVNAENLKYDIIVLDAFNSEYVPEHLMTKEFLGTVRSLLSPDGVLASNTFSTSALYDHESVTYADVFGDFYNVQLDQNRANRVILATLRGFAPTRFVQANAKQYSPLFKRMFDIEPNTLLPAMEMEPNWDTTARILTDQYSPANALQGRAHVNLSTLRIIDELIRKYPIAFVVALCVSIASLFFAVLFVCQFISHSSKRPAL